MNSSPAARRPRPGDDTIAPATRETCSIFSGANVVLPWIPVEISPLHRETGLLRQVPPAAPRSFALSGSWTHFATSLRLNFRNRTALLYGYLFPLIFLAAFAVLYRAERPPLLRHMGELLTIAILGGACLGLPTTLVSERERGIWRRYRTTPAHPLSLVASVFLARYVILLGAGALQLLVALALGTPHPAHPAGFALAFTLSAFAFSGLGLLMAMLVDNVPAVQAVGQCVFLPMLIVGGVAVPLASLPVWARQIASFLPGRYSVDALQAAMTGDATGLPDRTAFALVLTGLAGCIAAAILFRWDVHQPRPGRDRTLALGTVFAAWLLIGWTDLHSTRAPSSSAIISPATTDAVPVASPWTKLTAHDLASLDYALPSDAGVVAPIAAPDETPEPAVQAQLDQLAAVVARWPAELSGTEPQRARDLLSVAAVADLARHPVERFVPAIVLQQLLATHSPDDTAKILAWVALHPKEGTVIDDLSSFGVPDAAADPAQIRERVYVYALKFIARLTHHTTSRPPAPPPAP